MKVESALFNVIGVFLLICTVVYWFWSKDPTGTTALALATGLAALIGYYLWFLSTRLAGPRPEDRDAEIEEGAGELGFFSPHSWWPMVAAAGAAVTSMGIIFGVWLSLLGGSFLLYGALGFLFEYYKRGPSAHDRAVS